MTEMPPNSNDVSQTEEPERSHGHRTQSCTCAVTILRRNTFVVLTVAAVVIGFVLGLALQSSRMTARDIRYLSFPGELLMRMLQMLVLPLIVSSLVTGMSSLDSKASGRMGMQAIVYYMVTTIIAVFTGIVIVVILQPGNGPRDASAPTSGSIQAVHTPDAFMDLIRNMFPSNLVEASFKQYKTLYSKRVYQRNNTSIANYTETSGTLTSPGQTSTIEDPMYEMVPIAGSYNGVNALGLVVFSISFGLVLGSMKKQGQPLRDFFDCLNMAVMRLVSIIIWYAPVGILFLIAGKMVEMRDLGKMGSQLGMYTLCVITGLLVHSLLILPLLYFIATHKNPYLFIAGLLQALLTALGTSSSSATLPITFRCLEENNGMDKRVTRFMLPVGATINMDGTALYEAVAVVFIAQVNNMDLNLGQIITISITATAASIGAAAIPQAGLVTMVIVLTSVGLPTEDITLIIAVDWLLDRLRTCTNVLGDSIGVGIVECLSQQQLQSPRTAEGNSDLEGRGKPPQHRDNDRPFHNHHYTENSF